MNTIVIGAGGQARIVYEILQSNDNIDVVAFIDNIPGESDEDIMGIPVLGPHSVVSDLIDDGVEGFIVAIGDNEVRSQYFEKFQKMGLVPVNAVHHTAYISPSAKLGEGVVVQSSVKVMTNATIGDNTIINTGTIIEHEVSIDDHAHVGPGTTVAGRVYIGSMAFVGMGCAVKEYTEIGDDAVVGAGSVVLDDVAPGSLVAGSPAEIITINK
jgi:UDP-perosamine 4-acetyltransferase